MIGESKVSSTSPLSPSELLIALHQIEAKSDMKSVMKGQFLDNIFERAKKKAVKLDGHLTFVHNYS